jgi:sugar transferase EpsL
MKRVLDVVFSVIFFVLFGWLYFLISILLLILNGRPILFSQTRAGKDGVPFVMYKFRTMKLAVSQDGSHLDDAIRITRVGAFLRSTSLDELPGFWNVLVGEMSLVGPRPLLMEYLPLYSDAQARRHEVRPGVTGWAQVNGRNAISWEDKFRFDVWYVDNRNLLLDVRILWLTLRKVLARDGISAAGEATMSKFKGSTEP